MLNFQGYGEKDYPDMLEPEPVGLTCDRCGSQMIDMGTHHECLRGCDIPTRVDSELDMISSHVAHDFRPEDAAFFRQILDIITAVRVRMDTRVARETYVGAFKGELKTGLACPDCGDKITGMWLARTMLMGNTMQQCLKCWRQS